MLPAEIRQYISNIHGELTGIRRELHANPQPGFEETFAAGMVQDYLARCNVDFESEIADTGIAGWLLPEDESLCDIPAVALRADMDALAIEEKNDLPYASRNAGLMHACGHDGHTAMLLGAAAVLSKFRRHLPRPVKFIFQPAEESIGGASPMIRHGVLDERIGGIRVNRIFAIHNWPELPVGKIGLRRGPAWASVDGFRITIHGKGGHGARPQAAINPIIPAVEVVRRIESLRSTLPTDSGPVVLTVCSVNAGTKSNIIPDDAVIQGTLRTFDDTLAEDTKRKIAAAAAEIASDASCLSSFELIYGYPVTLNDPQAADELIDAAKDIVGEENIITDYPFVTVSEDFSFYSQEIPACLALLGSGPSAELHNPHYDFNDDIITTGVELLVSLALSQPRN